MDLIFKITSCAIQTLSTFFVWSKLINQKIDFKQYKTYISIASIIVFSISNYYITNEYLRIVTITVFLAINCYYIFRESFKKCVIATILSQMLVMIAEVIFAIMLIFVLKVDPNDFVNYYFEGFLTNVIISIIPVILIQIVYIKKLYNLILKITDKINKNYFLIMALVVMFVANIYAAIMYYDFNFISIMFFNLLLTIICFVIVLYSFYNKNKYIKVYDKYNTTLKSLKEYEEILDKYRISSHENKNQLLSIRNMVPKTNKKTITYIDKIIENHLKDNDKIMIETAKIPSGGLRGLIYSKILLMEELKIHYKLEISKDIRTTNLINDIEDSTMLDICKVIGVFLDNAIEAVQFIEDKNINIEMYQDKKSLMMSISNNYQGEIKLDRLEEKGYSSKGNNRGFGLALTRQIINENKKLTNVKKISKNSFTQILKIKM